MAKYISIHPYADKMISKYGMAKTNKHLGLSDSGLNGKWNEGLIQSAYEDACETIWKRLNPGTNNTPVLYRLKCPPEKAEFLNDLLRSLTSHGIKSVQEKF